MKHALKVLTLAALVLMMGHRVDAQPPCRSDALGTSSPSFRKDLNLDLGDYGMLFLDASHPDINCARRAAERLYNKLKATSDSGTHMETLGRTVGPFQGWLEGAHLQLAFATALQLAARGELNTDFDVQLKRTRDTYYATLSTSSPYGLDPNCGLKNPDGSWSGSQNTCMDDHSVAASAFGWIAAYEAKRGRDATNYILATLNALNRTFSTTESICINNPNRVMTRQNGGPCNGTIAELGAIQADTKSLNHGFQDIPYGLGLMTLVSSAVIGLEEAGYITAPESFFSSDQKTLAKGLLREGQQKAYATGDAFKTDCLQYTLSGDSVVVTGHACVDVDDQGNPVYFPKMYPLEYFYGRYSLGTPDSAVIDPEDPYPQTAYSYDQYDESLFNTAFDNEGRKATFLDLGYFWHYPTGTSGKPFNPRPPLTGDNRTEGFFDGISPTGVASGWVCDQFLPSHLVDLHFYAGSSFETFATATTSNLPSEPAVNSRCKSGTSHRFQVTLPAWTQGAVIQAYGLDTTWKGFALVPSLCAQSPYCSW